MNRESLTLMINEVRGAHIPSPMESTLCNVVSALISEIEQLNQRVARLEYRTVTGVNGVVTD